MSPWVALPEPDALTVTVALYALLAVYVVVSLTIPFWVPIVQRHTGARGVYWVFSTLTYYAYLAWVIFATLLCALLYSWPPLGAAWLLLLLLRTMQFYRLARRSPAALALPTGVAKGARSSPESGRRRSPESGRRSPGGLGRVLLVGNGPSIRERELGGAIDSFDVVVRFNSFVTREIEANTPPALLRTPRSARVRTPLRALPRYPSPPRRRTRAQRPTRGAT